jgi:uncharacterized protein (TIGR02231 family)
MIAFLASLSFASVHEVDSTPSAVTVFADRARVTRTVTVELPSGRQEVVFHGLPAAMYSDGLTGDARGPGVMRGIDVRYVTATEAADRRVKEIEAQLEGLADQRQAAVDASTAAQLEVAAIQQARQQGAVALSQQMLVGEHAPQQASAIRGSLDAEETAARAAWRAADQRVRAVDDQVGALDRERSTLGSSSTDTWDATVHLDLDRAGRVEVDVAYLVAGASWEPRYDVRGDADKGKVELALSAMVTQTTGEDWDGVKLTVSSAQPGLGTIVPVLDPFWLQRPQYYPPPSVAMAGDSMAPSRAMSAPKSAPEAPPPPPPEPMQVAQAAVSVELAATSFVVARAEDVPADGTQRKVLLTTETMEADLRHEIVPRLDPRAYLVGKVKNTAEFPLLAGTAGVFLEGSYLGDFQLETVAPGDKFDVAFGVDDRVTVKRTPKQIQEGHTGVVGKRATARWDWEVHVKNSHPRPIQVDVYEQVPITTRDDVKVTVLPSTPAPTPRDDDGTGKIQFSLPLAAGAEAVVSWGYSIDYPAELVLGWME